MNDLDVAAFTRLFKDAYEKCFGYAMQAPITETESKLLSNHVIDETGLVIGFKSIKNYSAFIFDSGRQENPSIATLDTLARYVTGAPYTDEAQRKKNENHYPYWFGYKEKYHRSLSSTPAQETPPQPAPNEQQPKKHGWRPVVIAIAVIVFIGVGAVVALLMRPAAHETFTEDFKALGDDSLAAKGWFVELPDGNYWNRRGENAGCLTLFTLKGDNWPDTGYRPGISNLLLHKINGDCFTTELHLQKFVPNQNWQQAGIMLLEDTGFTGKSLRFTIAYNDYNGPYPKSKQVILQAVTSLGKGFGKPEEIAHVTILYTDSMLKNPAVKTQLDNSALRIEKRGDVFRILYAGDKMENAAFKEVVSKTFNMQPKYIGLFAIKGFVDSSAVMPVKFNFFRITEEDCGP